MSRSVKKGPFVSESLMKKIREMNESVRRPSSEHGPGHLPYFLKW